MDRHGRLGFVRFMPLDLMKVMRNEFRSYELGQVPQIFAAICA